MDKSLAALVAVVCVLMLVRLVLPERYRWRLDAGFWRAWLRSSRWTVRTARSMRAGLHGLVHWRSSRREARRLAEEAIRRARHGVEREGNVLRPKSFKRDTGEPRKPH